MTVTKPRNRQVAFRISEDEYERMVDACASVGARSLSDFARMAVCQLASPVGRPAGDLIVERIKSLDIRMRDLDRRLEQLALLSSARAS